MGEQANDEVAADAWLTNQFETSRPALHALAFRMLGSGSDADDVVQEAWLRLTRAGGDDVANLQAWLTTVVARVCLDVLRSRASRREEPLDGGSHADPGSRGQATSVAAAGIDLEREAQVADAVGLALLVVLDRLSPAERVAFVLHDAFDLPFEEIAPIVGRTPAAARQLASRARRRVRGAPLRRVSGGGRPEYEQQRAVVDAYIAASRAGDFAALLAVLDPDVVLKADALTTAAGVPIEIRGAAQVAERALASGRRAPFSRPALVNGAVGIIVAPRGRLEAVLALTISNSRVVAIDVVTEPVRLDRLAIAVIDV